MSLAHETVRLARMEKDIIRMIVEVQVMDSFFDQVSKVEDQVLDASVDALKSRTLSVIQELGKLETTLSYVSLILNRKEQ